jgi:hypothetical protein
MQRQPQYGEYFRPSEYVRKVYGVEFMQVENAKEVYPSVFEINIINHLQCYVTLSEAPSPDGGVLWWQCDNDGNPFE